MQGAQGSSRVLRRYTVCGPHRAQPHISYLVEYISPSIPRRPLPALRPARLKTNAIHNSKPIPEAPVQDSINTAAPESMEPSRPRKAAAKGVQTVAEGHVSVQSYPKLNYPALTKSGSCVGIGTDPPHHTSPRSISRKLDGGGGHGSCLSEPARSVLVFGGVCGVSMKFWRF